MNLQVTVEKAGNIQRKIKIQVPAETVSQHLQTGYSEVQKQAKMKGFRPGKVPLSIVKEQYGDDVRYRVLQRLVDESVHEAIHEEKIRVVGQPSIEFPEHKEKSNLNDMIAEDRELNFVATVEILPEFEVKGYTGLSLKREKTDVPEKDIQETIDRILASHGQLKPIEDESRKIKKGDFVDIDFKGRVIIDGKAEEREGMSGNQVLEIGSNNFIPGFEEGLIGSKKGEEKTLKLNFPEDYHAKELAGQASEFDVKVNELKEKDTPKLDDEFSKTVGYDTVDKFKEEVKKQLVSEKESFAKRKIESDIIEQLIKKNKFEVPSSLIDAQTRTLMQEFTQNLKQRGFTDEMIQDASSKELENLKKRAESQVRASLILESISQKESLEVTDADIDEEVKKMASSVNVTEEKIREFYVDNAERKDTLINRLANEKTLDFILNQSKVK